ncbi:tetratricopeptide repeat protein [Streptomyces sp. NPDC051105]|uniref:tetratricopeptide repeat protein n=1 Tax=Streptomyces sp. NPDC051105 TaxID=3154843 RepID=UPI003423F830
MRAGDDRTPNSGSDNPDRDTDEPDPDTEEPDPGGGGDEPDPVNGESGPTGSASHPDAVASPSVGDRDRVDFGRSTFLGPVVGKMVVQHGGRPDRAGPCTLPMAQPGFTGRAAELAALEARLRAPADPAPDAPVVCVVTGLGGMGKTALALKAAHRARKAGWFTGGALFVDLAGYDDNPVTPTQAVTSLLHALAAADLDPGADRVGHFGEEGRQLDVYRSHLAALADAGRRVLLVLDNVSDSAQISPLLPASGLHCVLITSRECHESLTADELPLGPLSRDESVRLIAPALRRPTDAGDEWTPEETEAVRELTRLCCRMPLALRIATALLHRRRVRDDPLGSLVEELRAAADRSRVLRSRGVDEYGRVLALAPVFDMSFRRLPPDRRRALCGLAQVPFPDFSTETAVVATGQDRPLALELLDDLVGTHLITGEGRGGALPERWRIHDLVRGYASALAADDPALVEEGREARRRIRHHYRTKAEAAARHLRAPGDGPLPDLFKGRAEALGWLDAERVNLVAAAQWPDEHDGHGGRDEHDGHDGHDAAHMVELALHLADFLRERRFFEDWVAVGRAARDRAARSRDRHMEASVCNNLGNALLRADRSAEAIEPLVHAADLFRALGDPNGEGMAWNNLGLAQRRSGRLHESLVTHRQACERFRATGDRSHEGRAWHNFGLALESLGRYGEAAAAFRRACALHHRTDNRFLHGDSLNSLGCVLYAAGRIEPAVAALRESLRIRQDSDNWYAMTLTWNNLARVLDTAGQADEARQARNRAAEAAARAGTATTSYGHHH